jgi:hypothetical protein
LDGNSIKCKALKLLLQACLQECKGLSRYIGKEYAISRYDEGCGLV